VIPYLSSMCRRPRFRSCRLNSPVLVYLRRTESMHLQAERSTNCEFSASRQCAYIWRPGCAGNMGSLLEAIDLLPRR
jgi:hypothetical protein